MAQRASQKSKRQAPPPRQRAERAAPADNKRADTKLNGQVARLESVEHERDQLKAQLAEAQAMIAQLEQARDAAVSRIDWAIDSLHNVLESDA
jgi:predicted RNase H-like nuclease (RuvC/YqgF family)